MNTNSITGRTYRIHGGPSRDLLVDAFKYAYDKKVKIDLDFGIAVGYASDPNNGVATFVKLPTRAFCIEKLSHEDCDGQGFIFSGYCLAAECQGAPFKPFSFKANFSAKSREGWIEFAEDTSAYPKP